ncbi:phytanoyl-CoA dioxygenase family protein [Candidatus Poribacteria bacterium]|nr:phytanoyl-CoA dioxygenase family protein [Candidatus Poribacteria bacterium]
MPSLTDQQLTSYQQDGYVIARQMFDSAEINLLSRAAKTDPELDRRSYAQDDAEGGSVRLTLWNQPGDSLYGMFARCRRIVDSMERILGGEVYHYHSKMILKDAQVGGTWEWHQDYGYWYQNGLLFPLLSSVMIAVDPSRRNNGCLQVLKGSHRMGRLNHGITGEQAGADREKVGEAEKRLELVYCELEPGDTLFFDCNLLHRSDQNRSDQPRWTLICCYNAARNDPYKDSHHPRYSPLQKVSDNQVKAVGLKRFADSIGEADWFTPDIGEQESITSILPDEM